MTGSILISLLAAVVLVNVAYVSSAILSNRICVIKDKACKSDDVFIKHVPILKGCTALLRSWKDGNCKGAVLNERYLCHLQNTRCLDPIDAPGKTYLYRLYDNELHCPPGFTKYENPKQLYSDLYCPTVGRRCPNSKLYNCPWKNLTRTDCEEKCNKVLGCAMYDYEPSTKRCDPIRDTCAVNELKRFTITNNYRRALKGRTCEDGGWGEWKDSQPCSATCGGGTVIQTRLCNNPEPTYGGKNCEGEWYRKIPCNEEPCPARPITYCREQGKECDSNGKPGITNKAHIFDQTAKSCAKICESIEGCESYIYQTNERWCILLSGTCRVDQLRIREGYDYYYRGCPIKETFANCKRENKKCVALEQKGWINSGGSAANCQAACDSTPVCTSANYDPNHGHCWLLRGVCTEHQLTNSFGWGDYYYPAKNGQPCPSPNAPIPP